MPTYIGRQHVPRVGWTPDNQHNIKQSNRSLGWLL